MTPAELADLWDAEAQTCRASAENTRSLSLYEREHERARTLQQCAMQLRLVTGPPATIIRFDGTLPTEEAMEELRKRLSEVVRNHPQQAFRP